MNGCVDGRAPNGGLIQASDGSFYGTTEDGGPVANGGGGTVFKITSGGVLTTVYNFCSQMVAGVCTDGYQPIGGLLQASNGNFYGTTYEGTTDNDGEVYELTPSGRLTALVNFVGTNGEFPADSLIKNSQGNFFGTTYEGGQAAYGNLGTVFEMTPSGTLNVLYRFCSQNESCTDGGLPSAGVVVGADGNLYGTTQIDGSGGGGTVFKLSPLATLSSNSLTFPSQPYNAPSTAQSVTFSNPYFGSISVSNVAISGADPGDFSETKRVLLPLAVETAVRSTSSSLPKPPAPAALHW